MDKNMDIKFTEKNVDIYMRKCSASPTTKVRQIEISKLH